MPVLLAPLGRPSFELSAEVVGPVLVERVELDDRRRTQISDVELNPEFLFPATVLADTFPQRRKFLLWRQAVVGRLSQPARINDCRATCGCGLSLGTDVAEMIERMLGSTDPQFGRCF